MEFGLKRLRNFEQWREKHTKPTTDHLEAKEAKREDSRKFLDSISSENDGSSKKKPKRNKYKKRIFYMTIEDDDIDVTNDQ